MRDRRLGRVPLGRVGLDKSRVLEKMRVDEYYTHVHSMSSPLRSITRGDSGVEVVVSRWDDVAVLSRGPEALLSCFPLPYLKLVGDMLHGLPKMTQTISRGHS